VCCSMLQGVAVYCCVLAHHVRHWVVAVCCGVFQCVPVCCCVAVCFNVFLTMSDIIVLQCVAQCCSALRCVVVCSGLQCAAVRC